MNQRTRLKRAAALAATRLRAKLKYDWSDSRADIFDLFTRPVGPQWNALVSNDAKSSPTTPPDSATRGQRVAHPTNFERRIDNPAWRDDDIDRFFGPEPDEIDDIATRGQRVAHPTASRLAD